MRHRFLKEHGGEPGPIRKARETLKASKPGYHEFLGRGRSNARTGREALERFVVEILDGHKGGCGYRRISRGLRRGGVAVSERRIPNVTRRLGPQAEGATGRRRRSRPVERGDPRVNLVNGVSDADSRNRPWVGDITHIPTSEGWLHLAAVVDAWHRKVVGWSMSDRVTERLATGALEQAVGREGPPSDCSLVFHDDPGVRYASGAFQRCLESHGIAQSMSGPGNPWDDALAESFFKTLKGGLVKERTYECLYSIETARMSHGVSSTVRIGN